MRRQFGVLALAAATVLSTLVVGAGPRAASPPLHEPTPAPIAAYGKLPLTFEPNIGQAPAGIDFLAHGPGYTLALAGGSALLDVPTGGAAPPSEPRPALGRVEGTTVSGAVGGVTRVCALASPGRAALRSTWGRT